MAKLFLRKFLVALCVFVSVGIIGFHVTEPGTTWSRAIQWVVTVMTTTSSDYPPTSNLSAWFQSAYGIVNFGVLTTALSTVIVPPVLDWWQSNVDGRYSVKAPARGHAIYLLVGPVDWEKVRSVWEALTSELRSRFTLVVVSDVLGNLSAQDAERGIRFVKGSLRDLDTYQRAGLQWAKAAFVCASSYDKPEADLTTAALVELIELQQPNIISIAEVVTPDNEHYFTNGHFQVDGTVVFDTVTLAALARQVKQVVGDEPIHVLANTVDELQAVELQRQLQAAGVVVSDGGREFRIMLPTTLDDPAKADVRVRAELHAQNNLQAVGLYVSVLSEGFFRSYSNTVCADRVMAKALATKLKEVQQ